MLLLQRNLLRFARVHGILGNCFLLGKQLQYMIKSRVGLVCDFVEPLHNYICASNERVNTVKLYCRKEALSSPSFKPQPTACGIIHTAPNIHCSYRSKQTTKLL